MKTTIYYLLLLIFIALITGFLLSSGDTMGMGQTTLVCGALVAYTAALSLVGEQKPVDEREQYHRYISTRIGFITGASVMSVGILYQLFTHSLDYWLLAGLIAINLAKIVSLIWLSNKK